MKFNRVHFAILIFVSGFNLTSCSDNEPVDPAVNIPGPNPNPNPNPNPDPGTFTVDFDGQTFTAANTQAYISGGSITINAYRAQGDSFTMVLDGTTIGSYAANSNLVSYSPSDSPFAYFGNHPTNPDTNTGTVNITTINTIDNTISGTFSFIGYWSDTTEPLPAKQFLNGVFNNLPLSDQSPVINTFNALVNGTDFADTSISTATVGTGTSEFIAVGASNAAGGTITVSVRSNLGVGTYDITNVPANDVVQLRYAPSAGSATASTSGTVTITEKTSARIKGLFNGTVTIGTINYQITGGNFDVAY